MSLKKPLFMQYETVSHVMCFMIFILTFTITVAPDQLAHQGQHHVLLSQQDPIKRYSRKCSFLSLHVDVHAYHVVAIYISE